MHASLPIRPSIIAHTAHILRHRHTGPVSGEPAIDLLAVTYWPCAYLRTHSQPDGRYLAVGRSDHLSGPTAACTRRWAVHSRNRLPLFVYYNPREHAAALAALRCRAAVHGRTPSCRSTPSAAVCTCLYTSHLARALLPRRRHAAGRPRSNLATLTSLLTSLEHEGRNGKSVRCPGSDRSVCLPNLTCPAWWYHN